MKCRICSNTDNNKVFVVKEMMFGSKKEFDYFLCSTCNCLQIREPVKDISNYYSDSYYSVNNSAHLKAPRGLKQKLKRWLINKRNNYSVFNRSIIGKILSRFQSNTELESLSRIKITNKSRILDVGCGIGAHLYFLEELGFENILGIDPFNENDILHDNGLRILKRSIKEIDTNWDIITYHHSLEHIVDPISELRSVNDLLTSSGVCIIRTPTLDSYAWQHYKENWVQIDAPRHYHIFSLQSIRKIAEETGFELYDYYYDSEAFQFWGSEQYKSGIALIDKKSFAVNPGQSIFNKKEIMEFNKKSKKLNSEFFGDQVVIYLRKIK